MTLAEKLLNASVPATFFEIVPPAQDKAEAVDAVLAEVRAVRHLVDAINLPEIHDESRGGAPRIQKFVPRLEPRLLGKRIREELRMEAVVNHCVVYDPDPLPWFRQTQDEFGIRNVVVVGGESSQVRYPGPSVLQAVDQVRQAELAIRMGGITIPSRRHEAERIREKNSRGLEFFTSQVLFDSNDVVWLIQRLNGLEARVFLSFAPVSHERDLAFLRWLGVDIPADLDRFLLHGEGRGAAVDAAAAKQTCLERSLDLSQRILMDVFDNLPPDPPPLGLNIEHINQRNFAGAIAMLERLGGLYANLVAARAQV